MEPSSKPQYSTWIRRKKIVIFWALSSAILAAGVMAGLLYPYGFLVCLTSLPFLYIAVVISLAAHQFSSDGGGYQDRIHGLILSAIERSGPILDIGCGAGNLLIQLARANPQAECVGIDYWGQDWEYSQKQCEANARLEGVENTRFLQGSASRLPFTTESFSDVVSCLTFHEVADVTDKTDSIREALRVLKPGGTFTFFDLFDDPAFYRSPSSVRIAIDSAGGQILRMEKLSQVLPLPFPLNTSRVLKHAFLVVGRKVQ